MRDIIVKRRALLASCAALVVLAGLPAPLKAADKPKIGLIGVGKLGGALAKEFLADAGYPVMLSARDLGPVHQLADQIGHGAQVGTPDQAAAYGDIVAISVPWAALPQVARDQGPAMKGKIVIDTCNPVIARDGPGAQEGLDKGAGVFDQQLFPGTRLVRAFNSIISRDLGTQGHRAGEKAGIELAGDDKEAMDQVAQIVRDLGFEPVEVGGLDSAKLFQPGTPVYPKTLTAAQIRQMLGLKT